MFDTMTMTKAVGAICGSLLVFLLVDWAGTSLYRVGGGEGEEVAQAYMIDTGAEEASTEGAEAGPDFATLLASADAAAGESVFKKCSACHKLNSTDGVGPRLNGVVGRAKGAIGGFGYSEAMLAVGAESWTPENLAAFIENPKKYLPGTKMAFNGLPKAEDRANLVAYLATVP
ncbi:MAG: cytochrome c family protein [Rhodobacter sp.]|nr:cytochrome c family protein [Rhodobacter sp.]